jgi:two-component system OmpR family sensor kinase
MFVLLNAMFIKIHFEERSIIKKENALREQKALDLYQDYYFYNINYKTLLSELKTLQFQHIRNFDLKKYKKTSSKENIDIYNDKYLYFKNSLNPFLVQDLKKKRSSIFIFVTINIFLIFLFILIIKKLLPLKEITKHIEKMPNSNLLELPNSSDEIEEIIKAINDSNKKIISLNESRKLFLRNIFHELLTPITKIKLTTNLLKEEKQKLRIENALERLENVINELRSLESIISQNIILNKQFFDIEEVINESFKISLNKIPYEIKENSKLKVDIKYFKVALKNLIDNAYKYGKNPRIYIKTNKIVIVNEGEKLKEEFGFYLKPFNHKYENSSKGMGLGIYITNEILKMHNFKLNYYHKNNLNYFEIELI